mgnify:CR=1 FL=1
MIKENIKFCGEVTSKISKIMDEKGIEGVTLFPMLRKEGNKLLLGSLIEENNEDLFNRNKVVRPKYWIILDNENYNLVELNKTEEKDYMDTNIIPLDKEYDDTFREESKEIDKFTIDKKIQYKKYLMKDIENEISGTRNKILNAINNTLIVDNEKANATDYLIANVEEEIENKTKEIVEFIVMNKYSAIIYYYQTLIEEILTEYKNTNNINIDKMKLASTILDTYYGEVYGIKYFFNI